MQDNTFDNSSFFDDYGLLHVEKGVFTENGPLFAAEYWVSTAHLEKHQFQKSRNVLLNCIKTSTLSGKRWFDPNPSHNNNELCHFSHDNMTGLYCLAYVTDYMLDVLPIVRWNCVKPHKQDRWYYKLQKKLFGNYIWPHPRDFILYLTLKHSIFGYLGFPFLCLASFVSASAPKNDSSGKCKWTLKFLTLIKHENSVIRKIAQKSFVRFQKKLKKEHGDYPLIDVFQEYFKNHAHPMHDLIKRLYEAGVLVK